MKFCIKPLQCSSFILLTLVTVKALKLPIFHHNGSFTYTPTNQSVDVSQDEGNLIDHILIAGNGGNEGNDQRKEETSTTIPGEVLQVESPAEVYNASSQPGHYPETITTTTRPHANVVTIAVLGRSGSGVSSTIQELIGIHTECSKAEGNETFPDIFEYTITDDGSLHQIKILDVPGFVDGRNLEQESQILASLKYYVQTAENPPDFYLGLTKFDDNRIDGIHSLFVQFLKRVELFHDAFLNNTNTNAERNVVFLLTHLMSETRANQRKPEGKIGQFRRIIQEYTQFPPPISIVVGDNKAVAEYGVKVENGYYRLPNKQLYPKNIWEALINATSNSAAKDILTTVMGSRESQLQCEAKLISPAQWEHFEDDADAFYYLLTLANRTVEENEINRKVENVFIEKSREVQVEEIVQKMALQLRLQQENITSTENLPRNLLERAAFFQNNKQFSATISAFILNDAFSLTMPEYTQALTVGYGYILMSDEISTETPFTMDSPQPSPIGYQIPNFMKCRKLVTPETQYFKSYSANMSDYIEERLKYLDFRGKENTTVDSFNVKVKEGFNFQPEEGDNVVTLTAVEEYRTLTCKLAPNRTLLRLNPEFISEVGALMKFDKHDRDSVNEWKSWFNKWGSHIVVHSYGGGRLHGSIVGSEVRNVLKSQSSIDETLNSIINFTPFTVDNLGMPNYRAYGGQSSENNARLYNLSETARKELLEKWKESLNADFIMLTNEFRLQPISKLISVKFGKEKGRMVNDAINILLRGNLEYSRRSNKSQTNRTRINNKRNQTETAKPQLSTLLPVTNRPTPQYFTSEYFPRNEVHLNGSLGAPEAVLQSQLNQTNEMILFMERKLEERKNQTDDQYQLDVEELERLKEERQRLSERRRAEMDEREKLARNSRDRMYGSQMESIQQQNNLEVSLYQQQIAQIRKQDEEEERRHQERMAEVQRQREEQRRREEEEESILEKVKQFGSKAFKNTMTNFFSGKRTDTNGKGDNHQTSNSSNPQPSIQYYWSCSSPQFPQDSIQKNCSCSIPQTPQLSIAYNCLCSVPHTPQFSIPHNYSCYIHSIHQVNPLNRSGQAQETFPDNDNCTESTTSIEQKKIDYY